MASKKIRMLLAGAGFMGKTHVGAASGLDSVEYVGVVDTDKTRVTEFGKEFGLDVYTDLEQAIEKAKPDAVDISTPTPTHLPLVRICAANGIHVLCEKPLALELEDVREIGRIAEKKKIQMMVAQVLRFWPEYVYARELARSGEFGELRTVDCRRLSPGPGWNSWMMRQDTGRGAVLDLQIHDVDFMNQLLGRPIAVNAVGRVVQDAANEVDSRWEYAGARRARTEATYMMPRSYAFHASFRLEFEEAVVESDSWWPDGERLRVFPREGKEFIPALSEDNPYRKEIDYFGRQLAAGQSFDAVPLEEAIEAVELCLLSEESCRQGARISCAR